MMTARCELPFGGCNDYCLKDTAPPLNPSGLAERPGTFRGIKRKRKPMGCREAVELGLVPDPQGSPLREPPVDPRDLPTQPPGTFRGIKRKRKPLGWRAMAPCVTSPHPETDRLEAKQLRMCLLSKRELGY